MLACVFVFSKCAPSTVGDWRGHGLSEREEEGPSVWEGTGDKSCPLIFEKSGFALGPACMQSCLTLCDPMDCNPPGSSVHGILQILEWVAMPFSRGSSQPQGSNPHLLCLLHWQVGFLPLASPGKPQHILKWGFFSFPHSWHSPFQTWYLPAEETLWSSFWGYQRGIMCLQMR